MKEMILFGGFSGEDTLCLLAAIGATLEKPCLDNSFQSGDAMDEVLLRCPNLNLLHISAGGEVLTRDSLERVFLNSGSKLEALTVAWERCDLPALLDILTN